LRNKSNIIGVKKQDILKIMIDSAKFKGAAISSKKQHDRVLQYVKHNLKRFPYHKKILNK
jgi:hypothetical protein